MKQLTRDEHLLGPGPKRILSLDGGGIRGILSLEFLKRIEDLLRARCGGDPSFRLCDYFDLIGGSSTGAIIAGALAVGLSVTRLQTLYWELGEEIFQRSALRLGLIAPKFPREPLVNALAAIYDNATLGSDAVRTGVMFALKRVDTGSPWMVHNNPRGKFFDGGGGVPNRDYLLHQLVYASAAAPHLFEPECIEVAPGVEGVFVDGATAAAMNPALHTLMLATLDGYGLRWPLGADKLLLVSVGTGEPVTSMTSDEAMSMPAAVCAINALAAALTDTSRMAQTVLQWMSDSPTHWQMDSEVGDLGRDRLSERPLLTYLRYDVLLQAGWLQEELGFNIDKSEVEALLPVDNVRSIESLAEIGHLAAKKQVREEHFLACFDLPQ